MRRLILIIFLFISSISIFQIKNVLAESLSVSLRVGNTRMTFNGHTSPNAFVTVIQNSVIIGTTVADSNGNWNKTIDADNPGVQSFSLYSVDTYGHTSSTVTYNINLADNSETIIDHVVLSPTLIATTLPQSTGDEIIITGTAYPSSTITLTISDGNIYTITPNSSGLWTLSFSTSSTPGNYDLSATANIPGSYLSLSSPLLSYTIASKATPSQSNPNTSINPSPEPSPLVELVQTPSPMLTPLSSPLTIIPTLVLTYDENNDGEITIAEMYSVIKNWIVSWKSILTVDKELSNENNGQPHKCDINQDQTCNLTDLSILLYYIDRK